MKNVILLFTLLIPILNASAEDVLTKKRSQSPVNITSDNLEFDREKNRAVFEGNVVVTQDNLSIKSDKMTVHYSINSTKSKSSDNEDLGTKKIERIESFGNVQLIAPDKSAYADKAVYNLDKNTLEMFNNVKLIQGQSELHGDKLVYNMQTGQAKISSQNSQKRVKAIINSNKKGGV